MVMVVFLCAAEGTRAATWYGGPDRLWRTDSNWSSGHVPLAGEDVFITRGTSGPLIDSATTAVGAILRMGGTGATETLEVTGGTLTLSSHLILGEGSGSTATLEISGGRVSAYSVWVGNVGNGILHMVGGELYVSGEPLYISRFAGSGHIQLDGGTIHTDSFQMFDATATVDVAGGILVITGDWRTTVNGYVSSGWITAFNGSGLLTVRYDGTSTWVEGYVPTSPYAYNPEPADGSTIYDTEVTLHWQAGVSALSHDLYFGTDRSEVENAAPPAGDINRDGQTNIEDLAFLASQWLFLGFLDPSADRNGDGEVNMDDYALLAGGWKEITPYQGNQIATEYTLPESLSTGQTYCWRVDEIGESETWKGEVWSFSRTFIPQTVEELYSDVDPRRDPLEVQVIRQWDSDGIHYQFVRYLVATWKGEKSIMAAYYGYPIGGTNLPAVLHCHGGGQKANLSEVTAYAKRGFAAMSINWGGLDLGESVNTDWGAIDPTQNFPGRYQSVLPYPETIDSVESPRNCSWYPIVISAMRALTFMEQQPQVDPSRLGIYGHSMGGSITTFVAGADSRVKAAAPSVGGAGFQTYNSYDLPNTARSIAGDRELFRRTMETQSYAPYINCPIFFLGATNDFNAKMDDVYRTWALIPESAPQRLTFAPHLNHRFTASADICRPLWFDQHLKGSFVFPQKPDSVLSLSGADHIPLFTVTPDPSQTIVAVDLYYSHDKDSIARFWRDAQAVQVGNQWIAQCPIMGGTDPIFNYLFAFANVTYQALDGTRFTISSDIHVVTDTLLQSAGIAATDTSSMLIDDFSRDFHDWYLINSDHPTLTEFWTRKITDPKWHGPANAALRVQIRSLTSNSIRFTLIENEWRSYRGTKKTFTKTISVTGSTAVQDILLPMSEFTGLTKWNELDQLGISPGSGSWLNAAPELLELRWVLN